MLLLSVSEFRNNISKYLKMSFTEKIAVKSKDGIIELTPNTEIRVNPSPSSDPWFDDPRNLAVLEEAMAQYETDRKSGKDKEYRTWDEVKKELKICPTK